LILFDPDSSAGQQSANRKIGDHHVAPLAQGAEAYSKKLAADLYPIMTEGMFPYEIYYVLATDEEIQRLSYSAAIGL
jgi:hypothetical protein